MRDFRLWAQWWRSPTVRLTASYLLIIMVLSISFSCVLYRVSERELERQLPSPTVFSGQNFFYNGITDYQSYYDQHLTEGRQDLLLRLVLLNIIVLIGGAALSHYLARRTLEPIERAMDTQGRFVTDASHELRTPLTVMLTSNEVTLRKPKLTLDEAKAALQSNLEEIARLKTLSDGLLDLARQDDSPPQHLPVSLQDIAGDALDQLVPAAQAKRISVDDAVPNITVFGDRASLVQVAVILLDNAIKYSSAGSTVRLQGRSKNGYGSLTVADEGPGIASIDLPHIFDRFYRADTARTKSDASGYGIGLSIAQKIAGKHGGKISVRSTVGKGTSFTLRLPLYDPKKAVPTIDKA